jgi:hypothetical protein
VLLLIEHLARRTLIAGPVGPDTWQLDVRLQSDNETEFMEIRCST